MYRYIVPKTQAKERDIHSYIRNNLQGNGLGLDLQDAFVVQTNIPPQAFNVEVTHISRIDPDRFLDKSIVVRCHVAFDNRGRKETAEYRKRNGQNFSGSYCGQEFIYIQDKDRVTFDEKEKVISRFSRVSGLRCLDIKDSVVEWGGEKVFKKFRIFNNFYIKARFVVEDRELFYKAYLEGCGSRRSYGFGMIVIDRSDVIEEVEEEVSIWEEQGWN